jgi:predicted kinase
MAREAENHIVKGQGAILDATFTRRAQREKMVYLADKHQTPLLVIHCAASAPTTQKRLSRRAAEGTDISDGRWDIYLVQKSADEPLDEIPASRRLELNTESAPEELASACESFLRVRLGQSHAEDSALQPNL